MLIAILPGDGIGREIVPEAVRVLRALAPFGFDATLEEAPIGGAGLEAADDPLPPATLDLARRADAILLGAVGELPVGGLLGLLVDDAEADRARQLIVSYNSASPLPGEVPLQGPDVLIC